MDNLNYRSSEDKFKKLANQIVNALRSPDILLLEEIQDDDGADDHGEVDAQGTLKLLIIEIGLAGGPVYEYRQIDPENNLDGGQPGGNIRVAFLFRDGPGVILCESGSCVGKHGELGVMLTVMVLPTWPTVRVGSSHRIRHL